MGGEGGSKTSTGCDKEGRGERSQVVIMALFQFKIEIKSYKRGFML